MEKSKFRVLVVDDYEEWRRYICSTLRALLELEVIDEVTDGLEAVHRAHQLQPDLIVLDIGLPNLNGIEAARQIQDLAPHAKILFVSENPSWDVAEAALGTGALGYVVKSDAGAELLIAVNAVLRGDKFVGRRFAGQDLDRS